MTTTDLSNQLQDADLAVRDADLITAGIRELHDALQAGRLDSITVTDITADVLPKLDALRAYLLEQVREVTA